MIEQWIRELIIERDAVVVRRHKLEKAFADAPTVEDQTALVPKMKAANDELKILNGKLGI
jgi:hypothetical protein